MTMNLLQWYLMLCVVMSIRETSDDVYDPDYADSHMVKRFVVNLFAWHYWFVIDVMSLWNAGRGEK